jgi:hypothetical protein
MCGSRIWRDTGRSGRSLRQATTVLAFRICLKRLKKGSACLSATTVNSLIRVGTFRMQIRQACRTILGFPYKYDTRQRYGLRFGTFRKRISMVTGVRVTFLASL